MGSRRTSKRPPTVLSVTTRLVLDRLMFFKYCRTYASNSLGISIRALRNTINRYRRSGIFVPDYLPCWRRDMPMPANDARLFMEFKENELLILKTKLDIAVKGLEKCLGSIDAHHIVYRTLRDVHNIISLEDIKKAKAKREILRDIELIGELQ